MAGRVRLFLWPRRSTCWFIPWALFSSDQCSIASPPRWIITCGAIIAATGYVLTGFINTPLSFYLTYGLLVGLGAAGMGVVVCSSSVGKWFIKKRGIALGIATMGISFGTVLLTPLAGYIGKYFSWRIGLVCPRSYYLYCRDCDFPN